MTDLLHLIKSRRSVRRYKEKAVSKETILQILDVARWAPTGGNLQPWRFVVVTDPRLKEEIGRGARFYFLKSHHVSEVPVLIVICGDTRKSDWYKIDCSLAGENLMIAAHALGLGSCWIGIYDEERVKEILNIPDHFAVVGLVTLGYPAEIPKPPPRLDLEEVTSFNSFTPGKASGLVSRSMKAGPLSVMGKVTGILLRPIGRILEKLKGSPRGG